MKKKKLLSLLLVSLLAVGVLGGCSTKDADTSSNSTKIEVVKESAFDTVPENSLVPSFVTERYEKHDELLEDYNAILLSLGLNQEVDNIEEVKAKYGITGDYNSSTQEIYAQNKDFYSGFAQYYITSTMGDKKTQYTQDMIKIAQDYLENTLMEGKNEVPYAPEFSELNPESFVKKYLKENKIKVTNIIYPQGWKNIHIGPASTVISCDVTIEGTQDGKSFKETKRYNFHFTVSDDLRNGETPRRENCLALIGVTDNCFDTEKVNEFNVDKFLELT